MCKEIIEVEKDGIGSRLGLSAGDLLISVNGKPINDVFDYRYLILDNMLQLEIQKKSGALVSYKIEKNDYDDLGLVFNSGLMDDAKSCKNKCIFCFIDQLPKNMRKSLYFKDDDSRLSFLHGNYVTLTNMKEQDLERITYYHLSPINISVHSIDPDIRQFMLKNPAAANIIEQLEILRAANIEMNFQIVLCKGVNDGAKLDKTISGLGEFMPNARSLSVVPAGLTDYRQDLHPIDVFSEADAQVILSQIEKWQDYFLINSGTRFVYAGDEFYLKAQYKIPPNECYEDFPQLENGVGMLRIFEDEFIKTLKKVKNTGARKKRISLITGQASFKFIKALIDMFTNKFIDAEIKVYEVANNFFGKKITVSGLLTGADILTQLKGCDLGEKLLIPSNALRNDDMVFLDNYHPDDLARELKVPVIAVNNTGRSLINALMK